MTIDFTAITSRMERPAPLQAVSDAFAFYHEGERMMPAYEHGDLLLVNPARPPMAGGDVALLTSRESPAGIEVYRLLKIDDKQWTVCQYKPARKFKLPRKEWPFAFPVTACFRAR